MAQQMVETQGSRNPRVEKGKTKGMMINVRNTKRTRSDNELCNILPLLYVPVKYPYRITTHLTLFQSFHCASSLGLLIRRLLLSRLILDRPRRRRFRINAINLLALFSLIGNIILPCNLNEIPAVEDSADDAWARRFSCRCCGIAFHGHEAKESSCRGPAQHKRLKEKENVVDSPVNKDALTELYTVEEDEWGLRGTDG